MKGRNMRLRSSTSDDVADLAVFGLAALFIVALLGGYLRHIIWSIDMLMNDAGTVSQYVLAGIGAIMPPVGIIHGLGLVFGAW